MKTFLLKTIIYFSILVFVLAALVYMSNAHVLKRDFQNWNTEGNLFIIKENQSFDLLILGISHAKNFSRHKNHFILEKALNKKIINLGKGGGLSGVYEQYFYLKYFYKKGNKVDTILYVLSPSLLSNKHLGMASNSFVDEPIKGDFFFGYIKSDAYNKKQKIFHALKGKLSLSWLKLKPSEQNGILDKLDSINTEIVKEGQVSSKNAVVDKSSFIANYNTVEQTIKLSHKHNTTLIFIIPPAIFGKWPFHNETLSFIEDMNKKYKTEYYDFSCSVFAAEYYYDHHHLNTRGVKSFTEKHLKNIFRNNH